MSGSLEMVSDEPHVKMEEMAATCHRRVLGARPDLTGSRPALCRIMYYGDRCSYNLVPLAPDGEGLPRCIIDAVGGGPAGNLNGINDPEADVGSCQEEPLNLQAVNWYHWGSGCPSDPWSREI